MCGRVLIGENKEIERRAGVRKDNEGGKVSTKSNGNPGSLLPVVTDAMPDKVQQFRWGLLRYWDNEIHSKCKHARLENLLEKPTFRDLVGSKHCVTKIQGFFEYNQQTQTQYYISNADGSPMYIAGIWDIWMDVETNILIPTFAMITTEPNEAMRRIHDRMPVLLERNEVKNWLNASLTGYQRLSLLKETPSEKLKIVPASEREVQKAPIITPPPQPPKLFGN